MTTAVRPKSGLDWAIEIPECVSKEDPELSTGSFNTILYNIALAGRFGFTNMPKRLPLTEQALLATFRTLRENIKPIHPEDSNKNVQTYLRSLGEAFYWYIRLANSEPQVGHFVGNGFDGNNDDADRWQHAGH